jgi:hypothetical protein
VRFSAEIVAETHRKTDDSHGKMSDANLIAALPARLEDEDEGVLQSALKSITELARHGAFLAQQSVPLLTERQMTYVTRC